MHVSFKDKHAPSSTRLAVAQARLEARLEARLGHNTLYA